MYPELVLGLSDHTPGHSTVLGAISLGARIIEKHFTDDIHREGPDHLFSMNASTWREMVDRARELENSLGTGCKKIEANEKETVVIQRRSLRLTTHLEAGSTLKRNHLSVLRPCPSDAIQPYDISQVVGKRLRRDKKAGDYLRWNDVE
jgi:N-acetylneuraminate synthase